MYVTTRKMIGLVGIAATLLLHSLLFVVAAWGGAESRPLRQPDAVGGGANTGTIQGQSTEREITLLLSPLEADPDSPNEAESHLSAPQVPSILAISGIDSLPIPQLHSDASGEQLPDQDAEILAQAKLLGVYDSQVRARIERAWTLPEPLHEAGFACSAQIREKPNGQIQEVSLDLAHCTDSPELQQSLVNAIFLASPLPPPPRPTMFVDRFTMVFHADDVVHERQIAY